MLPIMNFNLNKGVFKMKITIYNNEVKGVIKKFEKLIDNKAIGIFKLVKIEANSNGDVFAIGGNTQSFLKLKVDAIVQESGVIFLDMESLKNLAYTKGLITVDNDDCKVVVQNGVKKSFIPIAKIEDYEIDLFNSHIPCMETNTENLVIDIDKPLEFLSDLRILDKTTIKDKNSNRLLFKGINFNCEKGYAVSINGFIGTKINLNGFNKSHYSITVQGRCYSDLSKLIDKDTEQITFYSDRKMAMFVTSSFQYYISLIDGIYSNWNILVPNNAPVTRIEFDKDKFSEFTDVVKEHLKIAKPVKNNKGRNSASVIVGYQDGILMNIHTPVYKTTDYLKATKIEGNVEKLHIGVDSKFLQIICELYSKVGDGVMMDYWKSNSVLLFNFGKYSNVIAPINPNNFDDAKTIIADYEK